MKAQSDEGGGRRTLGDNTGCGAVVLQLITFPCVRSVDFNWTPLELEAHALDHTLTKIPINAKFDFRPPDLPKRNCGVGREVSILLFYGVKFRLSH
jgi:hypothetical protein